MRMNNIINEEIERFKTKSTTMEHENFKFSQNIRNSLFQNYDGFSNDFDMEISESSVYINWHIAFLLNDFGVENFVVVIDNVEGVYRLNMLNKQTDVLEQQTDKNIAELSWKFEVNDAMLRMNESLYIESLEFDFATNTCKVMFYDSE